MDTERLSGWIYLDVTDDIKAGIWWPAAVQWADGRWMVPRAIADTPPPIAIACDDDPREVAVDADVRRGQWEQDQRVLTAAARTRNNRRSASKGGRTPNRDKTDRDQEIREYAADLRDRSPDRQKGLIEQDLADQFHLSTRQIRTILSRP